LGEINLEWDEIEFSLWHIFDTVLDTNWLKSYAIFFSQQSHRARRDMLEALTRHAWMNNPERKKQFAALMGRVKRAAKKRNEIAHGLWIDAPPDSDEKVLRLSIRPYYGDSPQLTSEDLIRSRDQIRALGADLDTFAAGPWLAKVKRLNEDKRFQKPSLGKSPRRRKAS
jgi:hypothetical protein